MSIIADLHIHSKYSRAVSQKMDLFEIGNWADKKGINLVTTGDWTHPLWLRAIKQNLKEISPGIYKLAKQKTKFILTTELSSIYTQGDKVRRIHNLIFSPSVEVVEKINKELQRRGANLLSDGRPILGISSKNLLALLLEIDENILLVPCHIWTPWFSLFGSKSGFDSIEESFGELSQHIYAIETGLSSDPIMNWQIKDLENRSIVSFSDAHSGPKLGREATVFVSTSASPVANFSYNDIVGAIRQDVGSKLKIGYTIEFFPEEGKYHWSGHRVCGIRYNPKEVKEKGTNCPVCHRPLTIGVENRVIDLSERVLSNENLLQVKNSAGLTFVYDKEKTKRPFVSLVPLLEILLEVNNNSPTKAGAEYERLVSPSQTEFDILMKKTYEDIEKLGGKNLRRAIEILRQRRVCVDPGYDGVFGKVKIFNGSQITIDGQEKASPDQKKQLELF